MFRNREHAGRALAAKLQGTSLHRPLVLAVPRGGVIVGAALAREIGAEWDVLLVGRLYSHGCGSAGGDPVGAIAEDGTERLVPGAAEAAGMTPAGLREERAYQAGQLARRREMFRGVRPAAEVAGRTVIVVDDGVATGATLAAALDAVRKRGPAELIAAVPILPGDRTAEIAARCDRTVSVANPDRCGPLERHFADFGPVDDERVLERLREQNAAMTVGGNGPTAMSWAG